ncbi:MAG: TonB-dependent receptor [Bacteroidales bacterium]|nr:TonB-dependent receptor [Bacteroidales bacterium]
MQLAKILLNFAILFSSVAVNATGIIKGRVTDRNTGEPLQGVYVLYSRSQGVITNDDGSFEIRNVSGKISVTFQFTGYEPVTKEVYVGNDEIVELNISLETRIREIDQVVVSANRIEQRIAELSVSMDIIKDSFISGNHITDAQEIINKTPGIEVMDGQASVRGGSGFSYGAGSRVLALIDGLPMVSADAGNIKWQFLPLENLSQIEIIKGASSVLYGSSALNGVINFRTADATNKPATQFFAEAGIFGKPSNKNWVWWDTPRVFSSMSFSHLRKSGNTDIGISTGLLVDEGYRRLNGEKLGRIGLKIKHFSPEIEGLTYGLNINSGYTVKRDFVLWENATTGALKQQESATIELNGTFLAIDPFITYRKTNQFRHDLRMRFQTSLNRFPESEKTNSDAYSLFTEYQFWKRLSGFMDLTAGLVENYSRVISNMYENHTGLNLAGYAQLELRPVTNLKAVAGMRIEQNILDGKQDKIVPVFRAGLNWQAGEFTFLRASFGQGYRYPSIAEKHASTTLGSVVIFPNPDILSESGWSAEAGIKQGLLIGSFTGQADLSVFLSQNKNMIEYYLAIYTDPVSGLPTTGFKATNIEASRVFGSELELTTSGQIGKINTTLAGGYTFIYPVELNRYTNRSTGEFLKYRRMHSGKMTANLLWKRIEAETGLYFRSKILRIDSFFLNEVTGEAILPGFPDYWKTHNNGYFLIDQSIGYKINNKLKLSFAVKNLTNKEYMGRPGDIQPQRNYSLRLSGKF